jgi:hypothetical protein
LPNHLRPDYPQVEDSPFWDFLVRQYGVAESNDEEADHGDGVGAGA